MSTATHSEGIEPANTRFAKEQLKAFVERIERLEDEKKTIADDIRDVFAEAKANGFDVKALRAIIRLRKQEPTERNEQQLILDIYMGALGMLPLFEHDPSPSGGGGSSGGMGGSGGASGGGSSTKANAKHGASMSSNRASAETGMENAVSGTTTNSRGGSGVTTTREGRDGPDTMQASLALSSGETPGPRETNSAILAEPAEGSVYLPDTIPPPQPDSELSHDAVESTDGGAAGFHSLGTAPPSSSASWRAPHLFELEPSAEFPTFLLRGHPDCPVRGGQGPPEVRPP